MDRENKNIAKQKFRFQQMLLTAVSNITWLKGKSTNIYSREIAECKNINETPKIFLEPISILEVISR